MKDTANNVKKIANKTAKDTNETVLNLKNQISETGKSIVNKVRGKEQYSQVPQSDYEEWEIMHDTQIKVPKDAETISNDFEDLALKLNRLPRKKQKKLDEY